MFKQIWDKIPNYNKLRQQLDYGSNLATNCVLIAYVMVAVMLPYLGTFLNYIGSITCIIVSQLLIIGFILFTIKSCSTKAVEINLILVLIIPLGWIAIMIFPIAPIGTTVANSSNKPQTNVTYVTYSPSCPYCKVAQYSMNRAVTVYNATHLQSVKVVNIDRHDKTATQLMKHLQYKGEVIRISKNGTVTQTVYTLGNKKGPVTPSTSYVYRILQSTK